MGFDDVYRWEKEEHPKKSRESAENLTKLLLSDEKVRRKCPRSLKVRYILL